MSISEELDIQPIFRANSFLIEEGAQLERGEASLHEESLARIDFRLKDSRGMPLYVELDWSSPHTSQLQEYRMLLWSRLEQGRARLMWLIPDDIMVPALELVQVKRVARAAIENLVHSRERAKNVLGAVHDTLSSPVTLPRALMGGAEYTFPSIISACYFDGHMRTDHGYKRIGLVKQSDGRYLDILRCVTDSDFGTMLPELTVLLLHELLKAPYFHLLRGKSGGLDLGGFYGHIQSKRASGFYRPIAERILKIEEDVSRYAEQELAPISTVYGEDARRSDLLYRVTSSVAPAVRTLDLIDIDRLLNALIAQFKLQPTPVLPDIRHGLTNEVVRNSIDSAGYERDFAKRLIELATLKRQLIPVHGVPIIWVLVPVFDGRKVVYTRVQAQNLRLNEDSRLFHRIV